jgi:hypothetical protein
MTISGISTRLHSASTMMAATTGSLVNLFRRRTPVDPSSAESLEGRVTQANAPMSIDQFKTHLDQWAGAGKRKENRTEAKQRILDFINDEESSSLSLQYLALKTLPSLCQVEGVSSQITALNLSNNRLTSLTPEIGNLTELTTLILSGNQLTSLPPEIGRLAQLAKLYLTFLPLTKVPPEIGQLAALRELYINHTRVKELPEEIGNLTELTILIVTVNRLEALPASIGRLTNLSILAFAYNPKVRELPLSIGNIPGITYLDHENTAVPLEMIQNILSLCRATRDGAVADQLPKRLALWEGYGKGQTFSTEFLETLDIQQKIAINEWLFRLSKTSDFSQDQGPLAETACAMLRDLESNKEFREFFFVQVDPNQEGCLDRSAMAFNEIFTFWKLCTVNKSDPIKKRVELLAGLARTTALRGAVAQAISQHQGTHGESVETFLYYETHFRSELDLVTAITHMHYKTIGQRSWINEEALKIAVQTNAMRIMVELPAFQKVARESKHYTQAYDRKAKGFAKQMTKLDEERETLKGKEYLNRGKKLMIDQQDALAQVGIDWASRILNGLPEAAVTSKK